MNNILIICKEQFGYHTDIFKWCEHLRERYDVEVITFDGKPRIGLDDIKNHYVSNKGNRAVRGVRFILTCLWHILSFKGIIFVCYFKECHILKRCFPWKKMILDIRTLDVSANRSTRERQDTIIKRRTEEFDYVTIISEGLRDKLSMPKAKSAILPLGADIVSNSVKDFTSLRLLYIGTLLNRDVHKTIEGVAIALKNNPQIDIHYDIIGDGPGDELANLKRLVRDRNIASYVTFHGYIQHEQLKTYLDTCNIGVSFVPMTEYYEYQPVTKSFEYILSGLYTIATNTFCNREIITEQNGILIEDTPESFAKGVTFIYENRYNIIGEDIRETLTPYLWRNIVQNKMVPILEQFYNNR